MYGSSFNYFLNLICHINEQTSDSFSEDEINSEIGTRHIF
jgi:hypothetical protein